MSFKEDHFDPIPMLGASTMYRGRGKDHAQCRPDDKVLEHSTCYLIKADKN